MTFDPARPRYSLPFAGKTYDLIGTMGLIEAVESRTQKGIGQVAVEVVHAMTATELARLVTAVLAACGYSMTPEAAADLLWEKVGLTGDANTLLRLHLFAFLSICLAPPEAREVKAKEVGEMIGRLETASPGEPTRKSASARSAGRRPSSGARAPGTSPAPTKATP